MTCHLDATLLVSMLQEMHSITFPLKQSSAAAAIPGVIMKVRDETGGFVEPMGNVPRLLGWDEDWPFTLMIPDSFDNCGP